MASHYMKIYEGRKLYSLGGTLYNQRKYDEAEAAYRQAVSVQEQKLGRLHEDTLNSKFWLGHTL